MTKIFKYLNMDAEPNVTPPRKWWQWIVQNAEELHSLSDKILDRHSYNLDPKVFGYIHHLTESSFNKIVLIKVPMMGQSVILNTVQPPNEDYNAIIGLIDWCNEMYLQFYKFNPSLKKVSEYIPQRDKTMSPRCMLNQAIRTM